MFAALEILGLVLIVALHELGHAISGSLMDRKVTFTVHKGNPATRITGPKKMEGKEYLFVYSSGFFLTMFCFEIISPLFSYDYFFYFMLCFGTSVGDLFQIYNRFIKGKLIKRIAYLDSKLNT